MLAYMLSLHSNVCTLNLSNGNEFWLVSNNVTGQKNGLLFCTLLDVEISSMITWTHNPTLLRNLIIVPYGYSQVIILLMCNMPKRVLWLEHWNFDQEGQVGWVLHSLGDAHSKFWLATSAIMPYQWWNLSLTLLWKWSSYLLTICWMKSLTIELPNGHYTVWTIRHCVMSARTVC